jgi:hypothetical protein
MPMLIAQLEKVLALAALVGLGAAASAQTGPDFSGRWTMVAEPAAPADRGGTLAAATMGSGWGPVVTITQSAAALAVERAQFSQYDMQPPMHLTYALDGSENRNTINMGRGPQELVSKASWQAASLVITTTFRFSGRNGKEETSTVTQMLSLDASGSLVIATTVAGALGGPPATSRTTYKKG